MEPDPSSLLSLREVARAMRWSIDSVRRRVKDGELPHFRFGAGSSAIRIARRDLQAFLNEHYISGDQSAKKAAPKIRNSNPTK